MKDQMKPSVKELYSSLHAPESLRQRTLEAVETGKTEHKRAKVLEFNFKTLGTLAACFLLCFSLLLSGLLGGGEVNISLDGSSISGDAVIGRASNVSYYPSALPMSAKSTDETKTAQALKLDVDANRRVTVGVSGAILALENEQGELCAVPADAEIDGESAVYVIFEDADEIKVTFTSKNEEKTLVITENSDGEYSVRIK